jgi:hypothetical protein
MVALARAMMSIILILAAVAIKASRGSDVPYQAAGPAIGGLGCRVTWLVCVQGTSTGQLSSSCIFLNWAAVRRHIADSNPCFTMGLGFLEVQVEAWPAMSWQEQGAQLGPSWTSHNSRQVVSHLSAQADVMIQYRSD